MYSCLTDDGCLEKKGGSGSGKTNELLNPINHQPSLI